MSKKTIIPALAALLMLLLPQGASGQGPVHRKIDFISDSDGIVRESKVWSIVSLKDAPYTFLATEDGLFAYDGARLTRHRAPGVGVLHDIAWDPSSRRLYSVGNDGFGWWQYDGFGRMSYHPLDSVRQHSFWKTCIAPDGGVYFQGQEKICRLDPSDGSLLSIRPSQRFHYMYEAGGRIFVQDGDALCLIYGGRMEHVCTVPDRVMGIVERDGGVILALEHTGLAALDGNRTVPLDKGVNRILADAKVLSLAAYDGSRLLVGTTRNGLFVTDADGHIVTGVGQERVTDNSTILSLGVDLNGDIWLGMESGVARIDCHSNNLYLQDASLGRVRGIVSLPDGSCLIGSNKGAIIWRGRDLRPVPGTTGSVWSVACFDGVPCIAHDQGLFTLDGKGRAVPQYTGTGVLGITRCNVHPGEFICGTYDGLALFRQEGKRLRFVSFIEGYSGFCSHILMDERDCLWIRDRQKGFIRLSLDDSRTRVTGRKDFDLVRSESDVVFDIRLGDTLLFCCNRETYRIGPDSVGLVRSPECDRLLETFGRKYGMPSEERNASGPFLMGDGSYATGRMGEIRFSYGSTELEESLTVSRIEALGSGKRSGVDFRSGKAVIPYNMNTVLLYMSGNIDGNAVECRVSPGTGGWRRVTFRSPLQLTSLPFGPHDLELRIPGTAETAWSIRLNVLRPWYLTGWAFFAYALVLLLLVLGIRAYYKRKAREEEERIRLKADLKSKSKELANINFNNAERNRQLHEIKSMLTDRKTVALIDRYLADESDWEKSEEYFNVIYDGLLEKLKAMYPGISKTDMKICVYTKLNLSTKEIADIMNISVRSVEMARYRLRKRLGLPPGQDIGEMLKGLSD